MFFTFILAGIVVLIPNFKLFNFSFVFFLSKCIFVLYNSLFLFFFSYTSSCIFFKLSCICIDAEICVCSRDSREPPDNCSSSAHSVSEMAIAAGYWGSLTALREV